MHIVAEERLGLPQTSREAFDMLESQSIITSEIVYRMKAMVGFRNIAVQNYQAINQDILQQIFEKYLSDFTTFTKQILDY
ncbi:uncharacterized protein YutE (UPF0331/DUF86 family) [Priestia megaterium]|jgi:uncharacterized protein YutE (UPF0331/DUF86 family)